MIRLRCWLVGHLWGPELVDPPYWSMFYRWLYTPGAECVRCGGRVPMLVVDP